MEGEITVGQFTSRHQKLGMWVATACPWSSRQVSIKAYTRIKSTHVASMREELRLLDPGPVGLHYRA